MLVTCLSDVASALNKTYNTPSIVCSLSVAFGQTQFAGETRVFKVRSAERECLGDLNVVYM